LFLVLLADARRSSRYAGRIKIFGSYEGQTAMPLVYLIGIGPGGPDYLTMQAVAALRRVDVFFILEKDGRGKAALSEARRDILETFRGQDGYRVVTAESPTRAPAGKSYGQVVADWHRRKAEIFAALMARHLAPGEVGGVLVWGDPALYDSHVAIFRHIREAGLADLQVEAIPGITSAQLLAARHLVPLNEIGGDVLVTTARRMEAGSCDGAESAVVMLDSNAAFRRIPGADWDVYWGAYLGGEEEILLSGKLDEVGETIAATVEREKQRRGWIMDVYLLKRRRGPG
jgi:precorrin-6A synthase